MNMKISKFVSIFTLLTCLFLVASLLPVEAQTGTVTSTELINYNTFSSSDISNWINVLKTNGIKEFTLRVPAYAEFTDGSLSSSWATPSLNIISAAYSNGISVNVDIHTWYTTWDNYFDDSVSGSATYRATYLTFLRDSISKLDVSGVKAFMVLNEPQWQYATLSENNFIIDCVETAKSETSKPVSVRFMAGASPWESSRHYSPDISSHLDFYCINSYWDTRYSTEVFNSGEQDVLDTLSAANSAGKELWITEFGKSKTNLEVQRAYVEAWVSYANSHGIDRIFCWSSSPTYSSEPYNLFNGWTVNPAFYELASVSSSSPTPSPSVSATPEPVLVTPAPTVVNPVGTPTPITSSNPLPTETPDLTAVPLPTQTASNPSLLNGEVPVLPIALLAGSILLISFNQTKHRRSK